MALKSPLSVHASGLGVEKHLDVTDLEFTRTARGGYESASFSLPAWTDSTDPVLGPASRLMVDDGRNARRIWEGFLDLPNRTVSEAGHEWKIGAVGTSSVLGDRARAYIAIDTSLERWTMLKATALSATAEVSTLPLNELQPALVLQFPPGTPVDTNSYVTMQYSLKTSGQYVGGITWTRQAGITDNGYELELNAIDAYSNAKLTLASSVFNVGAFIASRQVTTTTGFSTGTFNRFRFAACRRGAATNVSADTVWQAPHNIVVRPQLAGKDGQLIATGATYVPSYVLAHEVVTDGITKFSNTIDYTKASIDTSFTEQIPHLAYPDPVRLPDILDDLALIEDDMVWEVLESNAQNLHRFNLRRYPTDIRYEADTIDGWDSPGGELNLANMITVTWIDPEGKPATYTASYEVPALEQFYRNRDVEVIDLGNELGSVAVATRIADRVNAAMQAQPYAGTLTVARPIRDLYLGREVQPWEIEPGYLVNVRDVDAPPLQLTEVTYRDADMSATLTLGTPTFSLENLVARLARRRTRAGGKPKNKLT